MAESLQKIDQFLCTEHHSKDDLCKELNFYHEKLDSELPFFKDLNEPRQAGLIGIASHIGLNDFMSLTSLFLALESRDYGRAAMVIMQSSWPEKIYGVIASIAETIKSGIFPEHKAE